MLECLKYWWLEVTIKCHGDIYRCSYTNGLEMVKT